MSDLRSRLLSTPRFEEHTESIDGVGAITYRALSRDEVLNGRERNKGKTTAEIECYLVSLAMVDPVLTPEDVAQWQRMSPAGELERITTAIMRLSGMGGRADGEDPPDREAYKSVRS